MYDMARTGFDFRSLAAHTIRAGKSTTRNRAGSRRLETGVVAMPEGTPVSCLERIGRVDLRAAERSMVHSSGLA
jgi:hypothetical protein